MAGSSLASLTGRSGDSPLLSLAVLHRAPDHPPGRAHPPHPLLRLHRRGEQQRQAGPEGGPGAVQHRQQRRPERRVERHPGRGVCLRVSVSRRDSDAALTLVLTRDSFSWFPPSVAVLRRDGPQRLVLGHVRERGSRPLLPAVLPGLRTQRIQRLLDAGESGSSLCRLMKLDFSRGGGGLLDAC